MVKMSNGKLERIAVDSIKSEANKPSSFLKADIPEGDKGISFDGEILVFKDASETIESLEGKVPVQVKGTGVNKFTNGTRTFSLEMAHFQNYYNSNGVILFVVEVLITGATKIFYKQLLPKELKYLISYYGDEKDQKTKSIEIRELDETSLDRVCRLFIKESQKQPPMLIESEAFNESEFTSYNLTSLTFNPKKETTNNIFEHDFTLYGKKDKLYVPMHIGRIESISSTYEEIIEIDNKQYNFNMKLTNQSSKIILLIEESLELIIEDHKNRLKYSIREFDSLATQLKIIPFLIDFLTGRNVRFRKNSFTLEQININENVTILEDLESTYSTLLELKKVFVEMGINSEEKIHDGDGTTNISGQIESLVDAVLRRDFDGINIKDPDTAKFTRYAIGSMDIALFYTPNPEPRFINAFSKELLNFDVRFVVEGESFPQSLYVMAHESMLAHSINCDLDIIQESFEQFDPFANEHSFNMTNNFCLHCLKAFDLSQNAQLLIIAENIYQKFFFSSLNTSNMLAQIVMINLLQIQIRKKGALEEEEYNKLLTLKYESSDNLEIQFCVNVLLESQKEAELTFRQLEAKTQEFYKNLPIYNLYTKLMS